MLYAMLLLITSLSSSDNSSPCMAVSFSFMAKTEFLYAILALIDRL